MTTRYKWIPFLVYIPNKAGTAVIRQVPITIKCRWDAEVCEWIVTPEAHRSIEETQRKEMAQ